MMGPVDARDKADKSQPLSPTQADSLERSAWLNGVLPMGGSSSGLAEIITEQCVLGQQSSRTLTLDEDIRRPFAKTASRAHHGIPQTFSPASSNNTVVQTYPIAHGQRVSFYVQEGKWLAQVQDVWGNVQVLSVVCAPEQTPEQAIALLASKTLEQYKYSIHILDTSQSFKASRVVYVGALGLRGGGRMRLGMTNIGEDHDGLFLNESPLFEKMGSGIMHNTTSKDNTTSREGKQERVRCPITSYHVSCKSYRPSEVAGHENLVGMVVYTYEGETEWYLNGLHCKIDYIVIKRTNDIEKIDSDYGQVHGKLFKSVFGIEPSSSVVASGFAYLDGRWRFNSFAFNDSSNPDNQRGFHSVGSKMGRTEQGYIMRIIRRWVLAGHRTFYTKDICDPTFLDMLVNPSIDLDLDEEKKLSCKIQ